MTKKILESVLRWMAKLVLQKQRPKIVAITGSVGKTTAKDAIALALATVATVRKSEGNYNNQIGVPLTIIGAKTGKKNLVLWLLVKYKFFKALFTANYPRVLVLEMGADRIGDIEYLTSIARPDVAVVTRVGEAHLEYFQDLESVQKEKAKLIRALPASGVAVLNHDDPRTIAMKQLHRGNIISFGLGENADVRGKNVQIFQGVQEDLRMAAANLGLQFEIVMHRKAISLHLPGLLGNPQVYAILSAFAVGKALGVPENKIAEAMKKFMAPPGRLRPLNGIKNTIILDDTYNSSPEAAVEALKVLRQIRARRRIAVLGDMLELGPATEVAHRKIGRLVRDLGIDLLFTVGERAKFIADEARLTGFARTKVLEFDQASDAGLPLQEKMQEGDIVLIKGSQGVRMEKIVLEVMANPERAGELLCRQTKEWLRTP